MELNTESCDSGVISSCLLIFGLRLENTFCVRLNRPIKYLHGVIAMRNGLHTQTNPHPYLNIYTVNTL